MADQNYQHSDPPAEEPACLPFKKRGSAEKQLPGLNDNGDFFFPMDKKMNLEELQKNAYHEVLKAFVAESSAISAPRIMIIKELKEEWNISLVTHTDFENQLKTDTQVQRFRKTSYGKGKEIVTVAEQLKADLDVNKEDVLKLQESFNVAPAKIPKEKEEPSSTTPEDSPIPSWGDVSPASLINNWVNIRMDGKDDYVAFLIRDYDAETEMHQLVTSPSRKELEDPCDWIDIRYFPPEDIVWQKENTGIPTHKCILKSGQTILHATSTAREKKPIKEVRKTASGIPIILNIDKGKSIG